jgi:Domain of unknown function (DUF4276)
MTAEITFAILAEDASDAEALKHLIRRHLNDESLRVKEKGYDGCGALRRKGARDIKAWLAQGVQRFVICHDADSNPPHKVREKVLRDVVGPSNAKKELCCVVIPVQEIEAWLIADEAAINEVIPSFRFSGHSNPESIDSPKEWLVKQSKGANGKPRYSPKTFNAAVAQHVQFDLVARKCASFRAFLSCLDSIGT